MQTDIETFHARLRRLRMKKKYTMKSVAQLIGVPETTYREWEYGRMIQGQPYVALANVLEVSIAELLAGRPADPQKIIEALELTEIALQNLRRELQSL
jgi:transcriptional regulator with XRE-family HTH domain